MVGIQALDLHSTTLVGTDKCDIRPSPHIYLTMPASSLTGRCMVLIDTGPAGIYGSFRAKAVGSRAAQANSYLQNHLDGLDGPIGLEGLVSLVVKALMSTGK